MDENLKFETMGDYWDEEIVAWDVDLLREYQDLFSNTFSEMEQ